MSIFVIGDLHLSFGTNKPMGIFGENWENHDKKIEKNWKSKVNDNDLVVLPGDFSWAMNLEDTFQDFEYLSKLPGKKLLLKGNHDYWWGTLKKMREYLKKNEFYNIDFLQTNYYEYENKIITGTRGWLINTKETDLKILRREKIRLDLELEAITKENKNNKEIIVFMHYPPYEEINGKMEYPFSESFEKYNIKQCYYGHLHGEQAYGSIKDFVWNNVEYKLVSADYLKFDLQQIKVINR